ncbi:zinc finger protein 569-like isoform X2 [Eleutherodactylus coqui]|uniref:zinc finger protein 569-like isoform X2 n=1 Tax=Eleutherodactylus coqui TaxID=57060 RepID=UPI0034623D86
MDVGVKDFEDIAVYFSKEEWRCLGEEQKRLYKEVMMENYTDLCSQGSFYLKPELIFKIERGKEPCVMDRALYDGEIPIVYVIVTPDILSKLPEVLHDDDESDCIYLEIDSDSETEEEAYRSDALEVEDEKLSERIYVESEDETTGEQDLEDEEDDDEEDGESPSDCVYVETDATPTTAIVRQASVKSGEVLGTDVDRIIEDAVSPKSHTSTKNPESPNNLLNVWYVKTVENGSNSRKEMIVPGSCIEERKEDDQAEDRAEPDQLTDLEFLCPLCPELFTNVSKFFEHQKVHEPKTPVCPECGARFSDSLALERHLLLHVEEKIQVCQECGECFTTRSALETHMKTHKGDKQWPCPDCGKFLYSKSGLDRHQLIHVRDKPVPCPQCGKCFIKQTNFEMHLRLHAGEEFYPCTECEKLFSSKAACERHIKAHTMERPHGCPQCGKRFLYNGCLVKHMRVHTGEKPYVCLDCGRRFAQSSTLNSHRQLHEDEKPYVCPECKKCFAKKLSFDTHLKIHAKSKLLSEIAQMQCENTPNLLPSVENTKSKDLIMDVLASGKPDIHQLGDGGSFSEVLLKNGHYGDVTVNERPALERSLNDKLVEDIPSKVMHAEDVIINGGLLGVAPLKERPIKEFPFNGRPFINGKPAGGVTLKDSVTDLFRNSWPVEDLSFIEEPFIDISSSVQSIRENSFLQLPSRDVYYNEDLLDLSHSNDPDNDVLFTMRPMLDVSFCSHPVNYKPEEKQHVCPECGKRFPYNGCLVKHLRTHTGEKPYACNECGKCFAQTSTLNCHKRTHTGERPYVCPQCGKGFTSQSHVVRHQAIHNVNRSFLCNGCGKEFSQRAYLLKHQKRTTCSQIL